MTDRRLIRLRDVTERQPSFLWRGRIPLGGLTVLDGDPGSGKSGITYDLVARVTTGRALPDGAQSEDPAGVILLQAEDSLECDVLPNLRAAGANIDNILSFDRSSAPLTFPRDIGVVEEGIEEINAKAIFIDPISSFLNVGMHQDQSVRRALDPLAELADRRNIAIVMVRHLTKSGRGNALYRGAGSIAVIGAARSGLIVGDDPTCNDKHRHILAVSKSNRASSAESVAYRTVMNRDGTIGIQWLGPSSCAADEIIVGTAKHERSALQEAIEVLQELLSEGPLPAKETMKLAANAGVAKRTLYRAKAQLDVSSRKIGGGPNAEWMWQLADGTDRLIDTLINGPITPRTPGPRGRDIIRNRPGGSSH